MNDNRFIKSITVVVNEVEYDVMANFHLSAFDLDNINSNKAIATNGVAIPYNDDLFEPVEMTLPGLVFKDKTTGIFTEISFLVDSTSQMYFKIQTNSGKVYSFIAVYSGLVQDLLENQNTVNQIDLNIIRLTPFLIETQHTFTIELPVVATEEYPYTYPFLHGFAGNTTALAAFKIENNSIYDAYIKVQMYGMFNEPEIGIDNPLSATNLNGYKCKLDLTGFPNTSISLNSFPLSKELNLYNVNTGSIANIEQDRFFEYTTYLKIKPGMSTLYTKQISKFTVVVYERFDRIQ